MQSTASAIDDLKRSVRSGDCNQDRHVAGRPRPESPPELVDRGEAVPLTSWRSICSRVMAAVISVSRRRMLVHDFHEFFAGGGMVRAGLGAGWRCVFANDFDRKKGAVYVKHWGDEALRLVDVRQLTSQAILGEADLIWGSFPCQDLSLAGNGAGLGATDREPSGRSGAS